MLMSKYLIWAPLAEHDFELILDYVYQDWGADITRKFIEKIEKLTEQILINPKQFPLINRKRKIRKCVVTKHNTLIYRERKGFVEILRIFDTRQDPKSLRYE
jgi:plasmid stabilization system protein ParE